jgi:hypothetical protein
VRPPHDAAALELGEVSTRCHRRHAEALLDFGDRHRTGRAHCLGDPAPPRLRQHLAALACSVLNDFTVSHA